jgi:hypothetical protein
VLTKIQKWCEWGKNITNEQELTLSHERETHKMPQKDALSYVPICSVVLDAGHGLQNLFDGRLSGCGGGGGGISSSHLLLPADGRVFLCMTSSGGGG